MVERKAEGNASDAAVGRDRELLAATAMKLAWTTLDEAVSRLIGNA